MLPAKRDTKKSLTTKKCDYPTDKETDLWTDRRWKKLSLPKQHKKIFVILHVCRISLKQLLEFFFDILSFSKVSLFGCLYYVLSKRVFMIHVVLDFHLNS